MCRDGEKTRGYKTNVYTNTHKSLRITDKNDDTQTQMAQSSRPTPVARHSQRLPGGVCDLQLSTTEPPKDAQLAQATSNFARMTVTLASLQTSCSQDVFAIGFSTQTRVGMSWLRVNVAMSAIYSLLRQKSKLCADNPHTPFCHCLPWNRQFIFSFNLLSGSLLCSKRGERCLRGFEYNLITLSTWISRPPGSANLGPRSFFMENMTFYRFNTL